MKLCTKLFDHSTEAHRQHRQHPPGEPTGIRSGDARRENFERKEKFKSSDELMESACNGGPADHRHFCR